MGLSQYKLTDGAIAQKGVVAVPDKLTGTAAQNKAVFDRLVRETVKELFNALIDALSGTGGAAEVGTAEIDGVTGGDVQTVLGSLKTILDAKSESSDMAAALSLKSDKSVTDLHLRSVSLEAETGVFTFTREDGSFFTIDTVLEKVATNWAYDADTQSLVLTLADGSRQSVPLSAFIAETEFLDSAQLAFSVDNHRVTATVKEGSITDAMLSSALIGQLEGCVSAAAGSATNAAQSETAAELYRTQAAASASAAAMSEANAAASGDAAKGSEERAELSASAAAASASGAAESKSGADVAALMAESYAHGGTGVRDGEDTDNAEYYKKQAAEIVGGDFATKTELSAHADDGGVHVTAAQKATWNGKQNALSFDDSPAEGSTNPVTSGGVYTALAGKAPLVNGKVPAANLPELGCKSYRHIFAAEDWDGGTITLPAATHGISGEQVLFQFAHLVDGTYLPGTWACVESWAEIDGSTHALTLHGPDEGYAGAVTLLG